MPLTPQRINIPISGGLKGDETPEYIDPPALFDCVNFYHDTKSSLVKRNGYWTRTIRALKSYDTGADDDTTPDLPEVPLQQLSPTQDGIGIDRFINAGTSVLFAAGGHLWSYNPDALQQSSQSPAANCIRGPEIPDVDVTEEQLTAITDPTPYSATHNYTDSFSICAGALNQNGLLVSTYVRSPGLPTGFSAHTEWHLRVSDNENGAFDIDVIDNYFEVGWLNPCAFWHVTGAVATILDASHHTLYMQRFDLATMKWDAVHTILNGSGNVYYYDAVMTDESLGYLALAMVDSAGHLFVRLWDVPNNDILWATVQIGDVQWTGTGDVPGLSIAYNSATRRIGVAWCKNTAGEVHAAVIDAVTGAVVTSDTTINGNKSRFVSICAVKPYGSSNVSWVVAWQIPDSVNELSDDRSQLASKTLSSTLAQRGYVKCYPGVAPVTQLFGIAGNAYMVGRVTLPANNDSTAKFADEPLVLLRPHHELYQNDKEGARLCIPMATWGYGSGVPLNQPPHVPLIDKGSDTTREAACVILGAMLDKDWGDRMLLERFDQGGPNRYDSAPLQQGGSIFACGNPWTWDGSTAFETAFIHKPVISKVDYERGDGINPPANLIAYTPGTYFLKAVYIHRDNGGRITYSEPSVLQQMKIPADGAEVGPPYGQRHITISGLFVTARRPGTVTVALYLSDSDEGDAHFAQLLSVQNVSFNINATSAKQPKDITIDIPNFSLPLDGITSPTIYTEDGTLPAGYPQLTSHLIRWNNRIWLGNGHKITHSREFTEGDQPAFPDDFIEYLDREVTGLSPFDDRMLLFSTDAVLYRSGEGPSDSGQNSSYSSWNFITHEVGCNNARSVVHTMIGVYFQSRRGLEILKGDGSITHILEVQQHFSAGSDTETGDTVLGTVSLPRDHQLRVLFSNPDYPFMQQLVLDYWTGTWSYWRGLQNFNPSLSRFSGDVTVVNDTVYLASPTGAISIEQAKRYDTTESVQGGVIVQTNTHVPWSVVSPWIKADGVLGFQRVWRSYIQAKVSSWTTAVSTENSVSHGTSVPTSVVTGLPIFTTIQYKFTAGTIGTPGITWQLSFNGGAYTSALPLDSATYLETILAGGTVRTNFTIGTVLNGQVVTVTYIAPTFGITTQVYPDYETDASYVEDHGSETILDLQDLREKSGSVRLGIHHANQQCSAYQLNLSSSDTSQWSSVSEPIGVYELVGLWSEFGIEPGTGRLREGAKK